MQSVTLYRIDTGEIRGTLRGSPETIAANLDDGTAAIAGEHDPAIRFVTAAGTVDARPPPPAPGFAWDRAARIWTDTRTPEEHTAALGAARAAAAAAVNAAREAFRLQFITPIWGQDLVYIEKAREAEAWLAGGTDPALFPLMAAEVTVAGRLPRTGETMDQVAQVYLNKAAMFRAIGARIDGPAMEAFSTIDAAATEAEAAAVPAAYVAQVEAMLAPPQGAA